MYRDVFTSCLRDNFTWLMDLGYHLKCVETNAFFEKRINDEIYSINLFWAEYDVIKVQGVIAYKGFDLVEDIIAQRGGDLDYTICRHWKGNIPEEFDSYANGEHLTGEFYISNENQVKIFSDIVKSFYFNEVILFYDEFKAIGDILNWLDNNETKEHSKLLVVNNNSMMLRKLIIMKESRSDAYKSLYKSYKAFLYQKSNEQKTPYVEMYEKFLEFESYFRI